jgi:iron complex outermembrane receptor protein
MKPSRIFRNAMLSGAASLALTAPAYAQAAADATNQSSSGETTQPAAKPATQPANPVEAAQAAQTATTTTQTTPGGQIFVTGIRQPYRGDIPLKDLPQSVTVISDQMLKTVGVTRLDAALDLASGVNRQNNFGGIWDAFAIRGFAGDENLPSGVLVNGFNSGRGFGGPRDASNIDHIDILKGPNSALFGRGEPGGTVNITTKKPLFTTEGSAAVSYGSFDTERLEGDFTTPIIGKHVAIRVNGAYNHSDTFRDILDNNRFTITPSLLVKFTPKTIFTYELEYIHLKTPFDRGVIAVPQAPGGLPVKLGEVPRSRFFGEYADGRNTVHSLGHQAQLQQNLAKHWNALLGFGYRTSTFKGYSSDPEITPSRQLLYLHPELGLLSRQRRYRDWHTKDLTVRGEISGQFATFGMTHHILFGADYDSFDSHQIQLRFRPPSAAAQFAGAFGNTINIFDPVYGVNVPGVVAGEPKLNPFRNILEKQRGWGIYAQDQIDITDAFKIRLGGRYDVFKPRDFFEAGDFNSAVGASPRVTFKRFSPQAGAVYEFSDSFSLYASYGEGFRPNSGTDVNSNLFKPETTRAYEAGAKFAFLDKKLNGTIALFTITKNNVITADPNNAGFSLALGKARSRGVEFDLNGKLPGDLTLWLSYAYLKAESLVTAGDPNGFGFLIRKGDPLLNIPKHSGNILLTKDFTVANNKLTIGGGVNYVSKRLGETGVTAFKLPAYTLVKLLASYDLGEHFQLSGDVSNLFDKHYYPSSYSRLWVTPGTPRTFTARISYRY